MQFKRDKLNKVFLELSVLCMIRLICTVRRTTIIQLVNWNVTFHNYNFTLEEQISKTYQKTILVSMLAVWRDPQMMERNFQSKLSGLK